jgi:hypothetical protein
VFNLPGRGAFEGRLDFAFNTHGTSKAYGLRQAGNLAGLPGKESETVLVSVASCESVLRYCYDVQSSLYRLSQAVVAPVGRMGSGEAKLNARGLF